MDNMDERWVEDRLAKLDPASDWQPNSHGALARLREGTRTSTARRYRWVWASAALSAAGLMVFAMPGSRAVAQRFWDRLAPRRADVVRLNAEDSPRQVKAPGPPILDRPMEPEVARNVGEAPRQPEGGDVARLPTDDSPKEMKAPGAGIVNRPKEPPVVTEAAEAPRPVEATAARFSIFPPEKTSMPSFARPVAVSPSGRLLAMVGISQGQHLLWIRALDSPAAQALPGTEGATNPFWSPDGRFLAFFAQGQLKTIEVSSGSVLTLCDAMGNLGGTWSRNGVIVFGGGPRHALYRVSTSGGAATPATALDPSRRESAHAWPHFLPDGAHFLYLARGAETGIYVGSLDAAAPKRLLSADSNVEYSPPGFLLFARMGILLAQPFDAERLQTTGEPIPVSQGVWNTPGLGVFSVSQTGALAYENAASNKTQLVWFDRSGRQLGTAGEPGEYKYIHLDLSPEGDRVVAERLDPLTGNGAIWLLDLSRNTSARFTFDRFWSWAPIWSPDGSRIVFGSFGSGAEPRLGLYQMPASGSAGPEVLLESGDPVYPVDWSPEGTIVYQRLEPKSRMDLWLLPLYGDRKPVPFRPTRFTEESGRISPDGRWMAYVSDESGRPQVYVQPFPTGLGKWQISNRGGTQPKWRRDGSELFYIAADRKLMTVMMHTTTRDLTAGSPQALFETRISGFLYRNDYSVTADGQRFLINTEVDGATTAPISVVLNWTTALKR